MKPVENIKKMALVLFIVTGVIHISSGLISSNNYFLPLSHIINKSFDMPFAITALIYGFTTIVSNMKESRQKPAAVVLTIIAVLILAGLLYINLLLPDKSSITAI